MSAWWDDFLTLLFKRAVLLADQMEAVLARYLQFLRRATPVLATAIIVLAVCFLACVALNIRADWLYQVLILTIALLLLTTIVIAAPVLVLSQAVYELLPQKLRDSLLVWQRCCATILFCALLAVVFIRVFRLWESPGTMITVLCIVAVLWLGSYIGWLRVSSAWRRAIAVKLQVTLAIVALVAMLPGPAGIVEELAGWFRKTAERSVFSVTRPTPEPWDPPSAEGLRFVDPGTGEPLLWFSRDDEGDYRLFKSSGFDRFGSPLECADTPEEYQSILSWQRSKDFERERIRRERQEEAARKAEAERIEAARRAEEQARREEAERRAAAELAAKRAEEDARRAAERARREEAARRAAAERAAKLAREAERARLASYISSTPQTRADVVVFAVDEHGYPWVETTMAVVDQLQSSGVTAAANVFSEVFALQIFDSVAGGTAGPDVVAMKLGRFADQLLLIRGTDPRSNSATSLPGLRTYSMRMTVSWIDANDGEKIAELVIGDVTGAGVNEAGARTAFIQRFAESLVRRTDLAAHLP